MLAARARKVDALLSRFPGPVTLAVGRARWLGVLAIAVAFVLACVFLLCGDLGIDEAWDRWIAWAGIVFFGLCSLVAVIMLLPASGSLTLDADGFETRHMFRNARTPWRQVSEFSVTEDEEGDEWFKPSRVVVYDDARLKGTIAETVSMLGGNAIMLDTYGLSHQTLAALMTQWRARALAPDGRPVTTERPVASVGQPAP